MKTFINSRNLTAQKLCEIITDSFPELHCSFDGEILVRKNESSAALMKISMQANYGKVEVDERSDYSEKIFEVIGQSLTKNYDDTKILISFAEHFNEIPGVKIELINGTNLTVSLDEEIAMRLRLWLKKDGGAIEMQPFENQSGRVARDFVEQRHDLFSKLEIFYSGNMVKYIYVLP